MQIISGNNSIMANEHAEDNKLNPELHKRFTAKKMP